jgi:hypothetical protein
VMLDLHIMTIHGGRLRSRVEFEALLARVRFSLAGVSTTASGVSIIEAAPTA